MAEKKDALNQGAPSGSLRKKQLMSSEDLANYFGHGTRARWDLMRHRGIGPRYYKIGRKILYAKDDVDAWLEAQAVNPGAE